MNYLLLYYFFYYFWFLSLIIFFFNNYSRLITLFFFSTVCFFSIVLCFFFNKAITWYQFYNKIYRTSVLNIVYIIGIDGLSLLLIVLSTFLIWCCLLNYWLVRYQVNLYLFTLSISLWFLLNVFSVLDFFFFFIFFEAVVIPMFFLVGIWGSRIRKIYAAYLLFIYTLVGSFFMLVAFIDIYLQQGTTSLLFFDVSGGTLFLHQRQNFLWIFLFLGFAVKVPIYPVHIWLPEAHVEAPTPGSILLAGVVLKLGSYGIIRFLYGGAFINSSQEFIFFLYAIALMGFIYCSLVALNQQDLKKIIAYSSIAHMNFSLLGLFSSELLGVAGAMIMSIGHGLTAAGLFFGIGVLYDRYKSRIVHYYGGLVNLMPIFSVIYFILILANFGFPGTVNFVGEFLLTAGITGQSLFTVIICNFGLILTLIYSLFLYNRLFFGAIKTDRVSYYCDITRLEFYVLFLLIFFIVWFGLYPDILVSYIYSFLLHNCL